MARPSPIVADVAIAGAGAAGLYAALIAAREGARVALVSATPLAESASYWAQGGLAAALAADDSPERHAQDTLAAGRGAGNPSAVRVLCEEAPGVVRDLEELGVVFDADREGRLALGLEGGHSVRRVVHAGGSETGRRIVRNLSAAVAVHPRVQVLERRRASRVWQDGDGRAIGFVTVEGDAVLARGAVLATGGAAALWRRTTNPPGSTGSGMLLALHAGAPLADLELMQFHPTAVVAGPWRTERGEVDVQGINGFLITEAIRGEGAVLVDATGERFVDELAPRDEVARAIQERLDATGASAVGLDMRAIDPRRFPNVAEALRGAGLDPERDLIPVAPAAHYMMGGVATDLCGRSRIAGLHAVGECSCNGLHGANRLASNSLTECFVFGRRAALSALEGPPAPTGLAPPPSPPPPALTRETRHAMWREAGLVRTPEGLRSLLDNEHPLARLIAASALLREETRGAHLRVDHPERDPALDGQHSVVTPDGSAAFERWD